MTSINPSPWQEPYPEDQVNITLDYLGLSGAERELYRERVTKMLEMKTPIRDIRRALIGPNQNRVLD
jgi:hypothetical protein